MILYVNGDSHSAGAEINNTYCFAEDDSEYLHLHRRPHPDNIIDSYGYRLAKKLNIGFSCDAESGSSNTRIYRTTKQFLSKTKSEKFVLIGWTSWERKEWQHNGTYYQISASGTDSLPSELENMYREYITNCSKEHHISCSQEWHNHIWELHQELEENSIPHLFFNAFDCFHNCEQRDWNNCYIDPYSKQGTYAGWLQTNGYKTVRYDSNHYGKDGHGAWAKYLFPVLTQKLFNVTV